MIGEVLAVRETVADDESERDVRDGDEMASVWDECSVKCPMTDVDVGEERDIPL
jgi:hypothetical protein